MRNILLVFAILIIAACGDETDVGGDYYAVDVDANTGSTVNGPIEAGNPAHDDSNHDNPIDSSSHENNNNTP